MVERVLLVDDEEALLKAYRRFLQPAGGHEPSGRRPYEVETLADPRQALDRVANHGPYAVVVSDYKMPGLDGIRFLEQVKAQAPATVRVMLTGGGDIATAIDAVNCGAVFRFLTKPCLPATLTETVAAALRQHQLIVAERELLEETVSGVVRVLMDTVALLDPVVSSRAYRVRRSVRHMVRKLGLHDAWQLEVAAMLSQFGAVVAGASADDASDHPALAARLLGHIPRFEEVAAMIERQHAPVHPEDAVRPLSQRDRIRLGGQVLRAALEFERALSQGLTPAAVAATLLQRPQEVDPALVRCLIDLETALNALAPRTVMLNALRAGMVLDEDLKSGTGVLVMARGHEVTDAMLARMDRMASPEWLRTPIRVLDVHVPEFEPLPRREREPAAPVAPPP